MRSTFYGLEIAKTGLFTAQNSMEISGHNISNADTEGYTRQRLDTAAMPPGYGGTLVAVNQRSTAGRGVTTINVEQVRNSFLDYQYRKENSETTMYSVKEQYFEYVEALFNNELDSIETSTGVSKLFSRFYDAMYELQENPERTELRVNLQENAIALTEMMNYYSDRLKEQQNTLNESVKITVNEINTLSKQIAQLNKQIASYELSGAKANDLRDQRNMLLDTLSGLVDITVNEDTGGQLTVEVNGKAIIRHTSSYQLAVSPNAEETLLDGSPKFDVVWADSKGRPTTLPLEFKSGALKGYMDIRDGSSEDEVGVPFVLDQLDKLCQKIAQDVNEVHQKGYTIPSDEYGESRTGVLFFNVPLVKDVNGTEIPGKYDYSQITAANFKLSDAILSNVNNIAASDMPINAKDENGEEISENTQKGNGKIALAMCQLIWKKDDAGNPDNIDGVYKSLLNAISIEMDDIHNRSSSQEVMQLHLSDQRKSISDVSLDEEMTNIIRFGHAYNAASRVISAIDEELDKLINGTGRVGL